MLSQEGLYTIALSRFLFQPRIISEEITPDEEIYYKALVINMLKKKFKYLEN